MKYNLEIDNENETIKSKGNNLKELLFNATKTVDTDLGSHELVVTTDDCYEIEYWFEQNQGDK